LRVLPGVALALAALSLVALSPRPALAQDGPPARAAARTPRVTVELEAGPFWQTRNDVQIPNDASGTRFSLRRLTGSGPWPAGRLYVTWNLNERHGLRALVAPLSITEQGTLARPARFAGAAYTAGAAEGTYTFNSYRITYRYRFHEGGAWTWWVGFTGKVRDANIELEQGGTTSRKTDLGFVPLLHVAGDRRLGTRWRARLDADALAGGPGRAEDVSLKLAYDLSDRVTLAAGYRTVEGGADVDEVFTFAWLHYAVASATFRF
jgi:hypothetical protein